MYFENYKHHSTAQINPGLLWEYNITDVDLQQMRNIVVQRVIERGWPQDWYAMLNIYGEEEVKNIICDLSYLNDKDMYFVSLVFSIPLSKMKCFEKKQLQPQHWNS